MQILCKRLVTPSIKYFSVGQYKLLKEEKKKKLEEIKLLPDPLKKLETYIHIYQPKHDYFQSISQSIESINYEKDVQPAIQIYQDLGFKKSHYSRLWSELPSSLLLNQSYTKNDIQKLVPFLKQRLNLEPKHFRALLFKYPKILQYSNDEINQFFTTLEKQFELSKEGLVRLIQYYPILLNHELEMKIAKTIYIFQEYVGMTPKELGELQTKFPYFLDLNPDSYSNLFKHMYFLKFTNKDIKSILNNNVEFLTSKVGYFIHLWTQYDKMTEGQPKEMLLKLIVEHPRLLLQCPHEMVIPKVDICGN